MSTRVWVDLESGTFGGGNIMFVDLTDEQADEFGEVSDSSRIAFAKDHGHPAVQVELNRDRGKTTKNMTVFDEEWDNDNADPTCRSFYVNHKVLKAIGSPRRIRITVENIDDVGGGAKAVARLDVQPAADTDLVPFVN